MKLYYQPKLDKLCLVRYMVESEKIETNGCNCCYTVYASNGFDYAIAFENEHGCVFLFNKEVLSQFEYIGEFD